MKEAYCRQISLPEMGSKGQQKLNSSSILVVGVGGLGCSILPYLAASGIHRIGMIDFDQVEISNLARQTLFGYADVGRWKVDVAKERLSILYPDICFETKRCRLTTQNAQNFLFSYDIIIDGTDNFETRLVINDTCFVLQKPWVYGSIYQWQGQISLFLPGNPDYRALFPEGDSMSPFVNCSSGGVLGPFVGLVGMIQALAAIKWLAGIEEDLAGKILIIDGKTWRFTLANLSNSTSVSNYEISYALLRKWMIKEFIQLVDVRESYEKQYGDLGGISFIPDSFKKDQKIVVYCQTGIRSFEFMHQLRRAGFDAYSLEGGINAAVNGFL